MKTWSRRKFALSLAAFSGLIKSHAQELASQARRSLTGFVYDERYLRHDVVRLHPESPRRLEAILREMDRTGLSARVSRLPIDLDPMPWIGEIHAPEHIAAIRTIPVTGDVAALAVAGALSGVKAVCEGTMRNAFCAIRPPGHHARNTRQEEGFCYYNNIAIAARYAQKRFGLKRVLIIDWDYHHGNGTEEAFYEDPSVLYFSMHNWHAYPFTGDPRRTGKGAKAGLNINVHLRCGANEYAMFAAWNDRLMPAVEKFKPELVLISAGFDARKDDPLGCFAVSDIGFGELTKRAMAIARAHAGGRLVSLLEGGYDCEGLGKAVCAHVTALLSSS
jgi:acetoin utilization deacetylase AcuC-like enzyme